MLPCVVMSVPTYALTATIWKESEGYVAKCSELGVANAGDSFSEALVNLKEVSELCLDHMSLTARMISIKRFLQVSS